MGTPPQLRGARQSRRDRPHSKGMKLPKPGDLGGSWLRQVDLSDQGISAYTQYPARASLSSDVLQLMSRVGPTKRGGPQWVQSPTSTSCRTKKTFRRR